jgi:HEAT repeat protein
MRAIPVFLLGAALLAAGCAKRPPLTAHGKPVAHWVEALRDPDARVRRKAVQVLGNVGTADPAAIPALTGAVKDKDARVRSAAVLSLLKIGPDAREAIPVLHDARNDKDPKVRAQAALALAKIQGG